MSGDSIQNKYFDKIISSNEFSASQTYIDYLRYLLEATKDDKCLKETTIAIEFFGKDSSFNPAEDTTVRSHTYTLRKKLQNYYYNEGQNDKYRLKIPKGHYIARFVPSAEDRYNSKKYLKKLFSHYQLIIILILVGIISIFWFHNRSTENMLHNYQVLNSNDPIWHNYIDSKYPALIVVGDHFFFDDYSEKYKDVISIRNGKINSLQDMEQLKTRFPNDDIHPTEEPYFPYHSIWSLPPIFSIFNSVNQKPVMRRSSSVSPQILGEYNIIYVGSIKTLYTLKHTLTKSHLSYEILPHKVTYTPVDGDSPQVYQTSLHSTGQNEDLVIALKLPGPNGNAIFIIASYHSLGAPEVVNYLVNQSTRQTVEEKFIDKYGQVPEYFEILFRVTGIDKTAYNTEILVLNKISDS